MIDSSLYCKIENCHNIGINDSVVDDDLQVGNDESMTQADETLKRFETNGNYKRHLNLQGCASPEDRI